MRMFKFDPDQSVIICHAEVAGRGTALSLKMALDTGATYTMIPIEAAVVIGKEPLRSRRKIRITTVSGVEYVAIITIPRFRAFGIEIKNMDVICHNLSTESPIEGLLGLDFLKNAGIIIDFSKSVIRMPE